MIEQGRTLNAIEIIGGFIHLTLLLLSVETCRVFKVKLNVKQIFQKGITQYIPVIQDKRIRIRLDNVWATVNNTLYDNYKKDRPIRLYFKLDNSSHRKQMELLDMIYQKIRKLMRKINLVPEEFLMMKENVQDIRYINCKWFVNNGKITAKGTYRGEPIKTLDYFNFFKCNIILDFHSYNYCPNNKEMKKKEVWWNINVREITIHQIYDNTAILSQPIHSDELDGEFPILLRNVEKYDLVIEDSESDDNDVKNIVEEKPPIEQ